MCCHETINLRPSHRAESIAVDVGLAPLVCELLRLGIDVHECCEEVRPGLAAIEFVGAGAAEQFLRVALQHCERDVQPVGSRRLVSFPTADIRRLVERFASAERDESSTGPDAADA